MTRKTVTLQWSMSSASGWGVYGLNAGLHWAADPDVLPVFAGLLTDGHIVLDPLRMIRLAPVIGQSRELETRLAAHPGKSMHVRGTVLRPLGNGVLAGRAAHEVMLTGDATLGTIFFEHTTFDAAARERARQYAFIVTGSTWNQQVLERNGISHVATVLQGIDPTLFHPAPRSGLYADRFIVFSGGKLEHRKGQDLVLLAFRAFVARHPEALLVTAWHSPWPQVARDITADNSRAGPVPFDDDGRPDVLAWAAANGMPQGSVMDIGQVPNMLMPTILRDMDVAVLPSRCEGGTNLVAMECMACGIPTILSANTGHLDLVAAERCIPLARQTPVAPSHPKLGTQDWGESDVDEIVEALERVWRDRAAAVQIGAAAARYMSGLTWAIQIQRLKEAILPYTV
jgi:glycosyltransferase involved in cell wall biosynthesis